MNFRSQIVRFARLYSCLAVSLHPCCMCMLIKQDIRKYYLTLLGSFYYLVLNIGTSAQLAAIIPPTCDTSLMRSTYHAIEFFPYFKNSKVAVAASLNGKVTTQPHSFPCLIYLYTMATFDKTFNHNIVTVMHVIDIWHVFF